MNIDSKMIDDLAHLARLRFEENEKEGIRNDLQNMIAFVEKLQSVDTNDVKPLLFINKETNVLREDIIQGSVTREQALLNSPIQDATFFKVPKVIKK